MLTLSNAYATEFHAQHILQGEDLLEICTIAHRETNLENIFEQIESWNFQQFFGLACHLFVTTDSERSRAQLSNLLPKFGSIAVLSLLKIVHHFNPRLSPQRETRQLALHSLQTMALKPLVVGLTQVIEDKSLNEEFSSTLADTLISLASHHQEPLFSALSQQLSPDSWNNLQTQLLRVLSDARHEERFNRRERRIKVRIKEAASVA